VRALHKHDKIRYLENKLRIMTVFSNPHTFSQARDKLSVSEPTLTKHISRMLTEGSLEKTEKNYKLSDKGIENLSFLKSEMKDLSGPWKRKTSPNLLRYNIAPATGKVGTVQFSGIVESWHSPQTEISPSAIDSAMKTLVNSLSLDGSGTMKLSLEIRFSNIGAEKEP
jgi:hypothetical protein